MNDTRLLHRNIVLPNTHTHTYGTDHRVKKRMVMTADNAAPHINVAIAIPATAPAPHEHNS